MSQQIILYILLYIASVFCLIKYIYFLNAWWEIDKEKNVWFSRGSADKLETSNSLIWKVKSFASIGEFRELKCYLCRFHCSPNSRNFTKTTFRIFDKINFQWLNQEYQAPPSLQLHMIQATEKLGQFVDGDSGPVINFDTLLAGTGSYLDRYYFDVSKNILFIKISEIDNF